MNRKRLFKEINKLCLYLQDKYNINNGGCCYVAACIAEQLEFYSIPFKIIHYDLCNCHYCIKVSDRYLNRDDYKKYEITEVLEESSEFLYNRYFDNDWNHNYDTDNNSIIKEYIKKVFDENSRT